MKYLLLLTLLLGCGHFEDDNYVDLEKNPPPNDAVSTEFLDYVEEFEYYYGGRVEGIGIEFNDLPNRKAGVCITYRSGKKAIEIDRQQWDYELTEFQKVALIFHELGHCKLGRSHRDELRSDSGCPISFMNWTLVSEYCASRHFDDYVDEMFGRLM